LPEIPQNEELDFLISLHNLATSMGEVFKLQRGDLIFSFTGKRGTGSKLPSTVA